MRRAVGRGRRGPSLLGTAARTAVVVGTATSVSGKMAAAQQTQQQAPQPTPQPQVQPGPVAAAAEPISVDVLHAQLTKLAELRSSGLLTDAEFETQKARLLGA